MRRRFPYRLALAASATALALVIGLALTPSRAAAQGAIGGVLPGGALIYPRVVSVQEAKFVNLVRQQHDFSCGAAAVATILKYAYGQKVDEGRVLSGMLRVGDPAVVKARGFSMLDMKNYVARLGMYGVGYRVSGEKLPRVRIPVVVLLNIKGYEHFVVMRKATADGVYLADPALGNRREPLAEFAPQWNNVIFAIVGNSYRADNPLVVVEPPLNAGRLVMTLLPSMMPLSNQGLMAIVTAGGTFVR